MLNIRVFLPEEVYEVKRSLVYDAMKARFSLRGYLISVIKGADRKPLITIATDAIVDHVQDEYDALVWKLKVEALQTVNAVLAGERVP